MSGRDGLSKKTSDSANWRPTSRIKGSPAYMPHLLLYGSDLAMGGPGPSLLLWYLRLTLNAYPSLDLGDCQHMQTHVGSGSPSKQYLSRPHKPRSPCQGHVLRLPPWGTVCMTWHADATSLIRTPYREDLAASTGCASLCTLISSTRSFTLRSSSSKLQTPDDASRKPCPRTFATSPSHKQDPIAS